MFFLINAFFLFVLTVIGEAFLQFEAKAVYSSE